MPEGFAGRVALVTGSGNGIGRATALRLAARGATVGVNDLKPEFVEKVVKEIESAGGRAIGLVENVSSREGMRRAVLGFGERAGRLDVLVNNAAWVRYQAIPDVAPETLDRMLDIGFKAVVWGIQAAAEAMDPGRGGAIVNLASVAGIVSARNSIVYSGIKAGIMGITRAAAWTGESNQADANYGGALACAGDVNGDGFSDVVIGANRWDEQMSNMGKIYVYLGSSNGFNLYPDWSYTGSMVDGNLGISVANAGDVNGDGFTEVIVGNFPTNQEINKGSAFVFYGSNRGMSTQMATISLPKNPQASIGLSVASAGDCNGDGYSDVIAGVIWDQGNAGKAVIVNGSAKGLMLGANN